MLMIKLSSSTHIEQTGYMTWIHLIHKYFEDLLMQPISGAKLDQDDFLEGSPFCTSISDPGEQTMLHRHLQRLTVFLFFKCSLNIACIKGKPDELQFTDENLKYYSSANLNLDSESCIKSIGSIELHQWLETHVNADILANDEPYFVQCVRFSLSFLQLFMHEVCSHSLVSSWELLEIFLFLCAMTYESSLLNALIGFTFIMYLSIIGWYPVWNTPATLPCTFLSGTSVSDAELTVLNGLSSLCRGAFWWTCLTFCRIIKDEPLGEVKNHLAFLASDLFNPVHLFHLFLSEVTIYM